VKVNDRRIAFPKHFGNVIKNARFRNDYIGYQPIGSVFFFFFRHKYNNSRSGDKNPCRAEKNQEKFRDTKIRNQSIERESGKGTKTGAIESEP